MAFGISRNGCPTAWQAYLGEIMDNMTSITIFGNALLVNPEHVPDFNCNITKFLILTKTGEWVILKFVNRKSVCEIYYLHKFDVYNIIVYNTLPTTYQKEIISMSRTIEVFF